MERMPVPSRIAAFTRSGCPQPASCGITRRFHRLSRRTGWVAYALRTRAPLSRRPKAPIPSDLHVLGLPLAFILSQDQTLHCIVDLLFLFSGLLCSKKPRSRRKRGSRRTGPGGPLAHCCWPQTFKEPPQTSSTPPTPLAFGTAKIQPFSVRCTP